MVVDCEAFLLLTWARDPQLGAGGSPLVPSWPWMKGCWGGFGRHPQIEKNMWHSDETKIAGKWTDPEWRWISYWKWGYFTVCVSFFWSLPRQNRDATVVGVNRGDLVGFTIDDRNKHLPSQKHYILKMSFLFPRWDMLLVMTSLELPSDDQFSLLNHEQMSNTMRVQHQNGYFQRYLMYILYTVLYISAY